MQRAECGQGKDPSRILPECTQRVTQHTFPYLTKAGFVLCISHEVIKNQIDGLTLVNVIKVQACL
jgi:hypothetical protein